MTGGEKLKERGIGFLPFWVYSEVGERERERERERIRIRVGVVN